MAGESKHRPFPSSLRGRLNWGIRFFLPPQHPVQKPRTRVVNLFPAREFDSKVTPRTGQSINILVLRSGRKSKEKIERKSPNSLLKNPAGVHHWSV